MSQHAVFVEFNGQRQRLGTATQAEDGSFVVVLGGFLVIGTAEAGSQRQTPSSRPASGGAPASGMTFPPFGRLKGQPIHGADLENLEWYGRAIQQSVDDPGKARWRDRNQQVLDAINAEIIRQGGTPVHVREEYGRGHPTDGIGGPADDGLPF